MKGVKAMVGTIGCEGLRGAYTKVEAYAEGVGEGLQGQGTTCVEAEAWWAGCQNREWCSVPNGWSGLRGMEQDSGGTGESAVGHSEGGRLQATQNGWLVPAGNKSWNEDIS